MAEYTGWDAYVKEQEEKKMKDENPILEARLSAIENRLYNIDRHQLIQQSTIKNINGSLDNIFEVLKYNQIRLPPDHGPKRFWPSVGSHWDL